MLQRSSRASPMVQPVASDHRESSCMPGCHGKHPPQPAQMTIYQRAIQDSFSTVVPMLFPTIAYRCMLALQ